MAKKAAQKKKGNPNKKPQGRPQNKSQNRSKNSAKPKSTRKADEKAPGKKQSTQRIKEDKEVKKSETMKAYERQKKLEDTMPLGGALLQATSKLPVPGMQYRKPDRWGISKKIHDIKKGFGKTMIKIAVIVLALIVLLGVGIILINHFFKVNSVTIEGNRHYTNDQITDMVLGGRLGQNSIYLSMKYKNKDIEDIPFIETMNVDIVSPSAIKITVYEKAVAGFVEYMGRYFYFDKDGTVIESSEAKTDGIPQVLGLDFDHIILYEKLPVESDEVFKQILEMTQLLDKYGIDMEKIYFDKDYNMTLYFGQARIKIGDFTNIDEKIIRLKDILPELEGKKGVLRLDNYNGTDSIITFEVDK